MYRSSVRPGNCTPVHAFLTAKPPKPPCWLDLKVQNQRASSDEGGSKSSPVSQQQQINVLPRSSKPGKRMRAKIHRTRSQYCIESEDLPDDVEMTMNLAETTPKEIGLRKQMYDDSVYMQETTRKCQNWLDSLEECGPPETVTSSGLDALSEGCDSQVDVEVPDDTVWYEDDPDVRPPYNSSTSSSDDERTIIQTKHIPRSLQSTLTPDKTSSLKGSSKKYHYRGVLAGDTML
ncbi:uncharacterized protein LOC132546897 [Ylistrum balloti]|uniref:uncharacterized protein LOC132546897 n=1 Tax=Ylistrum balloti TaxID=509963 RepID=UPI002905DC09|nr:uncharacterized protein LOC132546897 [Ylistrum balloti]